MNERINELALQATINIGDEFHPIDFFHREKFAELIVRECADFLKDKMDDHFAAEQLEEHFGVKE